MIKVDADFLRLISLTSSESVEALCEERDIQWLDLVAVTTETACIAAKENTGMASFGVAMFKLGYEVRRQQFLPCLVCGQMNSHLASCPYFKKSDAS